jgi:hypothetical protein
MFVVSFHEQTLQYDLHHATKNKFSHYVYNTDGENKITGAKRANPEHVVLIPGYISKHNQIIRDRYNVYYGSYFAISNIDDALYEHLMSEYKNNPPIKNGIIVGFDNQTDAIAFAQARLAGGGIKQLDTGSRPLSINQTYYTKGDLKNKLPDNIILPPSARIA